MDTALALDSRPASNTTAIDDDGMEEYRRLILERTDVGQWRYDVEENRVYMDASARRLYGVDPQKPWFSRSELLERLCAVSADPIKEAIMRCFHSQRPVELDFQVDLPDGEQRHLLSQCCFLPSVNGKSPTLGGSLVDAKFVRPYKERVERERRRLDMLANGVPFAYAFLDNELRFRFINKAYKETYLRDIGEIEGVRITDVVDDSEFDRVVDVMGRALEGESLTVDAEGHRGSTVGRQIRYRLTPAREYDDGEIIGVLFQTFDITDLTELSARLERKHEELRRSNDDLEQFAYVASHDLKAPLRAISAIVGWLREDLSENTDEDVNENLDLLAQRTSRLSRLLDDLLAYSRAGRHDGNVKLVDVGALVDEVVQIHIHDDPIEIHVPDNLPTIMTDPTPLEQVLRNLISNAVKHHPGPKGHIWIDCAETDNGLEFSVADDGEGIPEEYADRVFKMFQTLKPRDEKEGSGMGLAIVARIIQLHGGRVWFEPRPEGSGTVFKFTWKPTMTAHAEVDTNEE